MVANCCICKSHPGQQEDVSFHKIPKNENLANEWIRIVSGIGINISKTATVCSKHFDDSQLQYKIVSGNIKRFLTSNAIPTKYVTAPTCPRRSSSNSDQETARKEKDDMEHDVKDVIVRESVPRSHRDQETARKKTDYMEHDVKNFMVEESVLCTHCDQETVRKEEDDMEHDVKDFMVEKSVLRAELVNDETVVDENSTLSKRKNNPAGNINRKRAQVKTIRYIGDISREDFTSDDAYRIVTKCVSDYKNEIKTLKQKVRRMNTKINTV